MESWAIALIFAAWAVTWFVAIWVALKNSVLRERLWIANHLYTSWCRIAKLYMN